MEEETPKDYLGANERGEFLIWLNNGITRDWISLPFCSTHDGDPHMTDEEATEWEDGGDPCCVVSKFIRGT